MIGIRFPAKRARSASAEPGTSARLFLAEYLLKEEFYAGSRISVPASPSLVRETVLHYSAMMDERRFWVYILASQRNGTLYCGVTNNLSRRIFEHKNAHTPGFTSKYGVTRLVWYEEYNSITQARAFETALKRWKRDWKLELIEKNNPDWKVLYDTLI